MAKQIINTGTVANDGTGDGLRTSFGKTNENFTELYTAIESIPTDVSDLTDNESLLGGGESSDRLVNGEYEFVLDADGNLTAPKDILVGEGGHIYIDGTGGNNVSVRWINMPSNEDYSIIRAYTGNPAEETDLSRGRIQLAWQDENRSGMRIISYDRTDEENSITRNWTFTGYGSLELPEGGTIVEGVVTDNPTIELTPANPDAESQRLIVKGGVFGEPTDYHLHLTTGDLAETSIFLGTDDHNVRTTTDGKIQITTLGDNTNIWEFGTDGTLTFPSTSGKINPSVSDGGGLQIEAEDDFEIKVNQYEGEPAIWSFAGTDITFPDSTVQTTAWTGILPNPTYSGSDDIGEATPAPLNLNNSAEATLLTQLNLINTGGGAGSGSAIDFWTYTSINDVPQVRLQAVDNGDYSADFAIKIKANGNGGNGNLATTWTFGADGDLTLPAGGDILDSTGASVLGGADTGTVSFNFNQISGNTNDGDGTIYTKTQDKDGNTYSTGGGSLGFLSFNADGEVENVKAGWTITFANGETRTVSQDAFQPLGTYWSIAFSSAFSWSAGDVMPVSFSSPDYIAASDPVLELKPDAETDNSWTFNGDGSIEFPDATVQTTAYAPVTGEWNVTTGTNTYNFTLPSDGTYTMWVKGNIPNGIIVWNATASVSNTNVPAIGTQYAWNYTGGGSPILLTAIPNQIRGTAGSISTDNTYVGTTSNRFDFEIANTSGASQTVYYGYTKV
jgi:hypothetical protein